jgi:hypothetical protein
MGPPATFEPLESARVEPALPIPSERPAPEACGRLVRRPTATRCPASRSEALVALVVALGLDIEGRDIDVAALEGCEVLDAASVRALRAELAPRICRDALAEPSIPRAGDAETASLLRAQTIEARMERVVVDPPAVPFDHFDRYVTRRLSPWLLSRVRLLEELSSVGPSAGAGRAIVTLARGRALLQLAAVARASAIPSSRCEARGHGGDLDCPSRSGLEAGTVTSQAGDFERGALAAFRSAAQELAASGIVDDARAHELAARLATTTRAGEPPSASRAVSLPGPPRPTGVEARLARALPITVLAVLLSPEAARPEVRLAVAARGLPPAWSQPPGAEDTHLALAAGRARLALGVRYGRSADVESALAYAQAIDPADVPAADKLWIATAVGLRTTRDASRRSRASLEPLAWLGEAGEDHTIAAVARFNGEILRAAALGRREGRFSPAVCGRARRLGEALGLTLDQRAFLDWCQQASDRWWPDEHPHLCRPR